MTSNTIHCHLCQAVLVDNESTIKQHISSLHLNYRPYDCRTCNEEGDSFKAATEERMDAHIAKLHGATNSGYLVIKDQMKETDLKAAIEECRRMSTLQLSPADTTVDWHQNSALNRAGVDENVQMTRDSKEHLRIVFISLGSTSTDAGNSSTEMEQENPEESRTKDLGPDSLSTKPNSYADNIPFDALPELQSLHRSPTMSSAIQSQAQLKSIAASDETFNQTDGENIHPDSTPNGQSTAIPLPSVEENASPNGQNLDEEFIERDAIESAIQTRSSSKKSAANFIQRKRTLPINDRHSRTKLSSKRPNHKKPNGTEKLHKCDRCSYASAKKCNVDSHMRTHIGEKPFKCDHCSFVSADKSTLNNHLRTHTGEKPYKCDVCPYASAQAGTLRDHMRIHTGERPFKCSLCSYASAKSSNLNVHIRVHTGEKPYKCSECAYASIQSSNLQDHVRRHHSKETE